MLTVDFSKVPIKAGDTVLDLGCGEGRHTLGAMQSISGALIIGIDLNMRDVSTARERKSSLDALSDCYFIQADGLQLPFADHSFDHIICSEVLEHIPDFTNMLREVNRLLKPNGHFIASVPRYWPEKICWWLEKAYHQVEGGHIRIFKHRVLRKTIEQLGFTFCHHHWAHALHVPYWWLRCAFWQRGEQFLPTRKYHQLLVWDLFHKPWITQTLDKWLNPLMGKSVVLYFQKNPL